MRCPGLEGENNYFFGIGHRLKSLIWYQCILGTSNEPQHRPNISIDASFPHGGSNETSSLSQPTDCHSNIISFDPSSSYPRLRPQV